MSRIGATLQAGSLSVLLFLLPFSKAVVEVTSVLLLLGWLLQRCDPATRWDTVWARPSLRRIALALGAFVAVCAASIAVSDHPSHSVRGFFSKWLEYLWMFVIAADLGARPSTVRRGALIMAWSSVFVVVEGVTQEIFGAGIFRGFKRVVYARMTGPYENPIDLGTYLMVAILFLLTYAMIQRGWRRGLLWMVLVPLTICLGRTLALGVWLAALAAVVMALLPVPAMRRSLGLFLGLTILSGGVFLHTTGHTKEILTLSDVGTADRVAMWTAATRMIQDRPLLGHGLNTFMANYLAYWVGGERQPRYAHNCYLQMAAETGLVGLAAFLWLLWLLVSRIHASLGPPLSEEGLLLLGLFAGLVAFLLQAGIDTNFYSLRQAALFWVLAGLALGLSTRLERSASTTR